MPGSISGNCAPEFQSVADAFEKNFRDRGEAGASVSATLEGETVVDLWGGVKDLDANTPWARDTISIVFSCTKAVTAMCAHLLVDRGLLDPQAKMTDYWPEFGANGKEDATVLMALNHSLGVPAFREPIKPGGFADWDYMIDRVAAEAPFWTPGEACGYHFASFGWIVGEIVRRVSGRLLGQFIRDEIAGPLRADFHLGLPESERERVAPMIPFAPGENFKPTAFIEKVMTDPASISHLAFMNVGGVFENEAAYYGAEMGGGGGVSNARALAKIFAPLANGGEGLFSGGRIEAMRRVSAQSACDETLLLPTRYGQGFMLNMDNRRQPPGKNGSLVFGERAFGHTGMGGSVVFADPEGRLSFSYTMTRMGDAIFIDDRAQSLIDSVYQSLGCTSTAAGHWD